MLCCDRAHACGAQGDFESDVLRLSFSSLATPPTTIDYNMATGKQCVAPASAEPVGACVMKPLTLHTGACPNDAGVFCNCLRVA